MGPQTTSSAEEFITGVSGVAEARDEVWAAAGNENAVAQRYVEMIVGRLVTDDDFRKVFLSDPHQALSALLQRGAHLTHVEIAALIATDSLLWEQVAEQLDARLLQKSNPSEDIT